jgi:hypothetical protein
VLGRGEERRAGIVNRAKKRQKNSFLDLIGNLNGKNNPQGNQTYKSK